MNTNDHIFLFYTTMPSLKGAQELAQTAVSQKLAACVNIIPQAISIYEWQGTIEQTEECILLLKTSIDKGYELFKFLKENHPYEVPAIFYRDVTASSSFWQFVTDHCDDKRFS